MELDLYKKIAALENIILELPRIKSEELIWDAFVKDLLIRLSWNSNSLEGNTLSLDETVAVIEYDEVRSGHTYAEYGEAKALYKAVKEQLNTEQNQVIDLEWIRKTNAGIMSGSGEYRTHAVYIGTIAEAIYYPPDYMKVPELMLEYENAFKSDSTVHAADMLQEAAKRHIMFERIHPFPDGNGRTGRIILSQQLLNYGMLPAIIKNQSKYRQAFRIYDRSGSDNMMQYVIADGIQESYQILKNIEEKYRASR